MLKRQVGRRRRCGLSQSQMLHVALLRLSAHGSKDNTAMHLVSDVLVSIPHTLTQNAACSTEMKLCKAVGHCPHF